MWKAAIIACAAALASCAQPSQQPVEAQQPVPKASCHAGADASGIAAGFFSFFTDDLQGCL